MLSECEHISYLLSMYKDNSKDHIVLELLDVLFSVISIFYNSIVYVMTTSQNIEVWILQIWNLNHTFIQ